MCLSDCDRTVPTLLIYRVSQKMATFYCIQFQRMQFHMIRSFSSCAMCIKLCVFTHSSFKTQSDKKFQRTTICYLN